MTMPFSEEQIKHDPRYKIGELKARLEAADKRIRRLEAKMKAHDELLNLLRFGNLKENVNDEEV